jgi:hypothetical protein
MSRFKIDNGHGNGLSPGAYYKEPNPSRVDPNSEESLLKWESSLQITRQELLVAIKRYGTIVRDIRRGLVNETHDEAA